MDLRKANVSLLAWGNSNKGNSDRWLGTAQIWAMINTSLSVSVKHMLKQLLLPVIIPLLYTAVFQATIYIMQMK